MKKLLDETSDELTRSLLLAARAHRPPAASRGRLLVALGAAGGIGLFSSKAFAWLGTSAGKLTLLGVGVAVVGGAYALASAPGAEPPRVAVLSLGTTEPARAPAPQVAAPAAAPLPSSVPASVADSPVRPRVASPGLGGATARRRVAPTPSAAASRTSRASSGTAARRDDALERMEPQQDGSLSAVLEPPAGGTVDQRAIGDQRATADQRAAGESLALRKLEAEIQLVDAMRGAAQRHDAEALRRLMDDYWGSFPEGQLKREVSELALRALPPAGH